LLDQVWLISAAGFHDQLAGRGSLNVVLSAVAQGSLGISVITSSSAMTAFKIQYLRAIGVVLVFSRAAVTRRLCDLERRQRSVAQRRGVISDQAQRFQQEEDCIYTKKVESKVKLPSVNITVISRDHPTLIM
jgi:hypothetical protein